MQGYRALSLLILLTLLVTACGRSTPTSYYVLVSATAPLKTERLPNKNLRVSPVNMPEYLDRTGIVSRVGSNAQVQVGEIHAWAESLSQGVRRVTQESLTPLLLPLGFNVQAPGDEGRGHYDLQLDVQRLDGEFNGKAVLEARWSLRNSDDQLLGRGIFADEDSVDGNDYEALVASESRLLRRMAEYFGQSLPALMKDKK